MNSVSSENQKNNGSFFVVLLKGSLISLSMSLILVLIFAFLLRFIAISDSLIKPINQIIKCASILIGTFIALKKYRQMGLISGLLIGVIYTVISFLVFSILDGNFEFGKTLVNDIFFGSITGAISGIIAVTFSKK